MHGNPVPETYAIFYEHELPAARSPERSCLSDHRELPVSAVSTQEDIAPRIEHNLLRTAHVVGWIGADRPLLPDGNVLQIVTLGTGNQRAAAQELPLPAGSRKAHGSD